MKKYYFLFLFLLTNLAYGVDPQLNVNFKATKEKIDGEYENKIEVVEMFWYGCIHCYQFEPGSN